jgi:3-dehydroquinate dehydratase-1
MKAAPSQPWKNYLARFPDLGKRPLIVGVLTSFGEATHVLKSKARPFDLVEWRLDLTGQRGGMWAERCFALEQAGMRVLLTIRSSAEGGKWFGEDAERLQLYRRGLEVVSMVDLEINQRLLPRVVAAAHEAGKPVIGSFHDFAETPPRAVLDEVVTRGWKSGADVVKLATRLKTEADLPRLLDLLRSGTPQRPLCAIGMGAPEARLALARAGSCLVYGFLGAATAPGQISCNDLVEHIKRDADLGE